MKSKSIYLIYSQEYNVGYVGKSDNLLRRFYGHCSGRESCVKQFCDKINKNVRDVFEIYEVIQCSITNASYYEGHVYDLIKTYLPQIKLINKNKPNRSKQDSFKNWRENHLEYEKARNKKWRANNLEQCKTYWKKWRDNNLEYEKYRVKQWRDKHPNYFKEYRAMRKNQK